MSDLKTWDSDAFDITLGTVDVSTGRGEGTFCAVKFVSEDYAFNVGADGETTSSRSRNGNATVELSVMRSSEKHRELHSLRATGLATAGGAPFALQLKDRNNGLTFSAEKALIQKAPDEGAGRAAAEATWTIYAVDVKVEVTP